MQRGLWCRKMRKGTATLGGGRKRGSLGKVVWDKIARLIARGKKDPWDFFFPPAVLKFVLFHHHYHLSPLKPPSPYNHHTVAQVYKSFFLFSPSTHHSCQPANFEHVFILLISSVCSLDSTHDWNHMEFVCLWLAYSLSIVFSRTSFIIQHIVRKLVMIWTKVIDSN